MKLSICIPLYNFPNYKLINELWKQIQETKEEVDLIVIDDGSADSLRPDTNKLKKEVNLIQLEQNVGRAKVRNLFVKHSQAEFLLFIDGDSQLMSSAFLSIYLEALETSKASVICGRSVYPEQEPPRSKRLRWLYGKKVEAQTVVERESSPYQAFMTNNFIIKRNLLERIPFEERLRNYGHEDTLMGFRLQLAHESVTHIDNPVMNANTEENAIYLKKTKEAIQNLIDIQSWIEEKSAFMQHVTLSRIYLKVSRFGFKGALRLVDFLIGRKMEYYFANGGNNLQLFALWKLCYYAKILKKSS